MKMFPHRQRNSHWLLQALGLVGAYFLGREAGRRHGQRNRPTTTLFHQHAMASGDNESRAEHTASEL